MFFRYRRSQFRKLAVKQFAIIQPVAIGYPFVEIKPLRRAIGGGAPAVGKIGIA